MLSWGCCQELLAQPGLCSMSDCCCSVEVRLTKALGLIAGCREMLRPHAIDFSLLSWDHLLHGCLQLQGPMYHGLGNSSRLPLASCSCLAKQDKTFPYSSHAEIQILRLVQVGNPHHTLEMLALPLAHGCASYVEPVGGLALTLLHNLREQHILFWCWHSRTV